MFFCGGFFLNFACLSTPKYETNTLNERHKILLCGIDWFHTNLIFKSFAFVIEGKYERGMHKIWTQLLLKCIGIIVLKKMQRRRDVSSSVPKVINSWFRILYRIRKSRYLKLSLVNQENILHTCFPLFLRLRQQTADACTQYLPHCQPPEMTS